MRGSGNVSVVSFAGWLLAAIALLTPARASLVAHYTFDDGNDLGLNTGSASVTWNSFTGVTQGTGLFGGGSGNFTTASGAWTNGFNAVNFDQFSMSLHVKTTTTLNWDDFISIGTVGGQFFLEKNAANGVSLFNNGPGGNTPSNLVTSGLTINDGNWHQLGITVGNNVLSLYADGQFVGSTAYTGSGSIAGYQLGSRLGDAARAITAELDDVAFYSTTLSADQMNWLSSNAAVAVPVPEPGISGSAMVVLASCLLVWRWSWS